MKRKKIYISKIYHLVRYATLKDTKYFQILDAVLICEIKTTYWLDPLL